MQEELCLDSDGVVIDEFINSRGQVQQIVLRKHQTNARCNYQFYCYLIDCRGDKKLQGYMYFTLQSDTKSSNYIGTYVDYPFRGQGVAQLLHSNWIQFCLEHDFLHLKTQKRQRKPFALYLLKKYSFEINNIDYYLGQSIHICQKDDRRKYLFFDNKRQEYDFYHGKIYRGDNYLILDSMDGAIELDKVLLNYTYYLQDRDVAYQKSISVKNRSGGVL